MGDARVLLSSFLLIFWTRADSRTHAHTHAGAGRSSPKGNYMRSRRRTRRWQPQALPGIPNAAFKYPAVPRPSRTPRAWSSGRRGEPGGTPWPGAGRQSPGAMSCTNTRAEGSAAAAESESGAESRRRGGGPGPGGPAQRCLECLAPPPRARTARTPAGGRPRGPFLASPIRAFR